jgi:hypothetical protein
MHVSEHVPPPQTVPATQAVPHLPQFALSVLVSTQAPLQSVEPAPQEKPHVLLLHTSPVGHLLPQEPQLSESDVVS